jgi:hypothetical protein
LWESGNGIGPLERENINISKLQRGKQNSYGFVASKIQFLTPKHNVGCIVFYRIESNETSRTRLNKTKQATTTKPFSPKQIGVGKMKPAGAKE